MNIRPKNYYKILQVDPEAELEVIESAYRRLALKYHPDTSKAPDATARMQEINEAYAVLKQPVERADYDKHYKAHFGQSAHTKSDPYSDRKQAPPSNEDTARRYGNEQEKHQGAREQTGRNQQEQERPTNRPSPKRPGAPLASGAATIVIALFIIAMCVGATVVWGPGLLRPDLDAPATNLPVSTAGQNTTTVIIGTPVQSNPTRVPATEAVAATITPGPSPTSTETFYVVGDGDTLFSIAEKFEVNVCFLLEINNITDPSEVAVGQQLVIPPDDFVPPTSTPLPQELEPGSRLEYIVRCGDTLDLIAAKFNSTGDDIATENGITDPLSILIGEALVVRVNIATATPNP